MITVKKLLDALAYQITEKVDPENGYTKLVHHKLKQLDTEGNIDFKSIEEAKQFKDDFLDDEVKVTVFDAVMGTGKSTGAIDYSLINDDIPIIILVELNTEVERYLDSLEKFAKFTSPKRESDITGERKRDVLQRQVEQRLNIITTHQLFHSWTKETLDAIRQNHYILILDEVLSGVYDTYTISEQDLTSLIDKGFLKVDDKELIHTTDTPMLDEYSKLANKVNTKRCHLFENKLIEELNPKLFKAFDNVIVLTYMFEGSYLKNFFDLYDINYTKQSFDNDGNIVDYQEPDGTQFKDLITFAGTDRQQRNYDNRTALSKGWFIKSKRKVRGKAPFSALRSTASKIAKDWTASGIDKSCIAWTTHLKFALDMSSNRFDDIRITRLKLDGKEVDEVDRPRVNLISQTARGTNDYKHKTHLIYLTNLFPNPQIEKFLRIKSGSDDPVIDSNAFALSNMLQWIWRSAIREGNEITVFIPAKRPRQLLMKWLGYADNEMF